MPTATLKKAPDKLNGISSDAVKKATGKTWPQWIKLLDAAGCRTMDHKQIVAVVFCHSGDHEQGERLAAPIRVAATAIADLAGPIPYQTLNSLLDPLFANGGRYYMRSGYLAGQKYMQGLAAALDVKHDKGHVVLVAFQPQWRGQSPWSRR